VYQIDAFKGPYFHEEFLKIYTIFIIWTGGYGVGLRGRSLCVYSCVLVRVREMTSTQMQTAMGVGSIPGYGSWVIVMIVNL